MNLQIYSHSFFYFLIRFFFAVRLSGKRTNFSSISVPIRFPIQKFNECRFISLRSTESDSIQISIFIFINIILNSRRLKPYQYRPTKQVISNSFRYLIGLIQIDCFGWIRECRSIFYLFKLFHFLLSN